MSTDTNDVARALWFTAPRTAEVLEEELSPPGKGEIRVRSIVSLVSPGTEMNFYRGQMPDAEISLPTVAGTPPFPIKYAYQIVGEVEAVGEGAPYAVGDRVFSNHPHQDRFVIAAGGGTGGGRSLSSIVFPVPPDLDPERAAFANLFCVAYNSLLDRPVRIGDCVAVSGLGIIGSLAAYLARRTAGRLILVDPIEERRERAGWIGADAVVHPDQAADVVAEMTGDRGLDHFIEASGAPSALQGAIDVTGDEGTIVVISYYGTREVTLRLSPEFHTRRQQIVSSAVRAVGSGLQPRWNAERRMTVAMEELGKLDVEPLVSDRVPLADAPAAYVKLDTEPQETFGILLEY